MFRKLNQRGIMVIEWLVIMAIIAGIGAGYMLNDRETVIVTNPPAQAEEK